MKYPQLTKAVKTKVVSYAKNADGSYKKDEKDNKVVAEEREIEIKGLEVPVFESLAEAVQKAGSEEKVLEALNEFTKQVAVTPVRIVGQKFDFETPDEKVIAEARALARNANPFEDRRGAGNAVNKAKAQQLDSLQDALAKAKSSGKTREQIAADLIALLESQAV